MTGRNIINIRNEFNKDPRLITSREHRLRYRKTEVPLGEDWKIDLEEMLEARQDLLEDGEEGEDISRLQFYNDMLTPLYFSEWFYSRYHILCTLV